MADIQSAAAKIRQDVKAVEIGRGCPNSPTDLSR